MLRPVGTSDAMYSDKQGFDPLMARPDQSRE